MISERLTRSKWRAAVEVRRQSQDVGEEIFGNGDLGHLKRNVATRADDLRAETAKGVACSIEDTWIERKASG